MKLHNQECFYGVTVFAGLINYSFLHFENSGFIYAILLIGLIKIKIKRLDWDSIYFW